MPIKRKLMAITMSVTSVALLLAGVALVASDLFAFRRGMQRDISALSEIVADNSTAALTFDDPNAARETLASLRSKSHIVAACIYRMDGEMFASYYRREAPSKCPPDSGPDGFQFVTDGLVGRRPVDLRGQRVGTLVILSDLGGLYTRAGLVGQTVLVILSMAVLVAFVLSSRLQKIIAMPISNLAEVTRSVSKTRDYSIRAQKLSEDELGRLAEGFNEMLVRIQSQDADLRKALQAQEAALQEVREIRDSLKTTLASIGDAVISTDTKGCVVFVNQVARSLLRMSEADLTGRPLEEVFHVIDEFTRARIESPVPRSCAEARASAWPARPC